MPYALATSAAVFSPLNNLSTIWNLNLAVYRFSTFFSSGFYDPTPARGGKQITAAGGTVLGVNDQQYSEWYERSATVCSACLIQMVQRILNKLNL